MHTLLDIAAAVVAIWVLLRVIGGALSSSWAGPRTPQMRSRAAAAAGRPGIERRAARAAKGSARPLGAMALHPTSRLIRAQAKADIEREWQKAFAADYVEAQRHARANGTAAPADTAPRRPDDPPPRWVPPHDAVHKGPVRGTAGKALAATGIWRLLPGRVQGALCGCEVCRSKNIGDEQWKRLIEENFGPNGAEPPAPSPNRNQPANGTGGPPARPAPPPAPAPPTTNGGTTVAGTSTASAEKLIEGINEIHAHAAAGGIHAKREAVKAIHEGFVRFAAMLAMLSRQMSEPGQNYGPEITEPVAQAGTHAQAGAMAASESDAALSTLINMTVGDLAASPRQAPHHQELSETGAR